MHMNPRNTAREFLSRVTVVKAPEIYLPGPGDQSRVDLSSPAGTAGQDCLDGIAWKILSLNAVPIPPMLGEMYDQLGLSRVQGGRHVKRLVAAGLAVVHQFHPSRRGGFIKVIEDTDLAYQHLQRLGITRPTPLTKGGWEHNLGCSAMAEIGKRKHYQKLHEVPVGLKGVVRIDIVLQNLTGQRMYVQCGISSPEREAINALKALELPAVTAGKFILICRDKSFATQTIQHIKTLDAKGHALQRIFIKLLGDVLEYYYLKSEGDFL